MINAYVLHRFAYRESSLIVDLFSEQLGRVSVLAKGARRPKSPWRGLLEPFMPLVVELTGKHELKTLSYVELAAVPELLTGKALIAGMYCNELLHRLLARELEFPQVYLAYTQLVKHLSTTSTWEVQLRYFELQLLTSLGFGLNFSQAQQGDIQPHKQYFYGHEQEFSEIEALQFEPSEQRVFTGAFLMAFATKKLMTPEDLIQAKRLMRLVLREHLGNKPLKTRELFIETMQKE